MRVHQDLETRQESYDGTGTGSMTSLTNLKPFLLRTSAPMPSKWTLHFSSAERISTTYVLRISRANPKESNPGPRLAVLAGTLTVTLLITFSSPGATAIPRCRCWQHANYRRANYLTHLTTSNAIASSTVNDRTRT